VKRPSKAKRPETVVEQPQPAPSQPPTPASSASMAHAQAAMSRSRRGLENRKPLPRGQRWKERRLPRVCWER
jgi:hypothetical protein